MKLCYSLNMNTNRLMRKLKYQIEGFLARELPTKSVLDFMELAPLEFHTSGNLTPLVCWTSWKNSKIPKSLYSGWKKMVLDNKEIKFYFFDDGLQEEWMLKHFGQHKIYDIYKRVVFGASKSDIFRLCITSKYGGIFLSINRLVKYPLLELIGDRLSYVMTFEKNIYSRKNPPTQIPEMYRQNAVAQWGIICPPGHPLPKIALKRIVDHEKNFKGLTFQNVPEAILKFDGTYLYTHAFDDYLNGEPNAKISFAGYDYFDSMELPIGAKYRYASEPSYRSYASRVILK